MAYRFSLRPAVAAAIALVMAGCASSQSTQLGDLPENDAELAAYLREAVASYQQELDSLPKSTGLDVSVAAYDTVVELTFRYRRENAEKAAAIARFTNPLLVSQGCADAERQHWMSRGIVFRFSYRDQYNDLILRSDIDSETCAAVRTGEKALPS